MNNASLRLVYRADGDKYLLVEFGPRVLDLGLRFRVHLLEGKLRAAALSGIIDITPGVRSLQIHYDNRACDAKNFSTHSKRSMQKFPNAPRLQCHHAPSICLSRGTTPRPSWRRLSTCNRFVLTRPGVQTISNSSVASTASTMSMRSIGSSMTRVIWYSGLGDVYLGAPVATPLDPRHRLVTTKYNPARTWTPENAVGIGGAYMCVYGMEGPGGYQLVGRTVQVWNTHRVTPTFVEGCHGRCASLTRFVFTQCRRKNFRSSVEPSSMALSIPASSRPSSIWRPMRNFSNSIRPGIAVFKETQTRAFQEERERWRLNGQLDSAATLPEMPETEVSERAVPEGCEAVLAPMAASVFKVAVEAGQPVTHGQRLVVLDAMKIELEVAAPVAGVVHEVLCKAGQLVEAGQQIAILCAG